MAHLHIISGKTDEAEKLLQQALVLFPGYHYALGNLAKVRIQQKRYGQAVDLLQQRYKAAPHAENLYDLAEALEWAGRPDAAAKAFAEFETKSLLESVQADNSNRELIFYYADHAHQPAKALNVARQEYARRHDVYTLDACAWSLHLNGQDAEAHRQIEAALAVGVRDARMLRHAGEIAVKLGDRGATFGHELLDFISGQLPLWRDRPDRRKETSETPLTSQLCAHLNSVARLSAGWDILQFRVEEADEQHKSRKIDLVAAPCGATICIEGRRYSDFESLMPSNARDCRYLRAETVTSANTVSVSTLRLGVFSVSKRATTAVPTRSVGCSVTYRREITSVGDPRWNGAICEVSSVA
jgi:hypothetical protein